MHPFEKLGREYAKQEREMQELLQLIKKLPTEVKERLDNNVKLSYIEQEYYEKFKTKIFAVLSNKKLSARLVCEVLKEYSEELKRGSIMSAFARAAVDYIQAIKDRPTGKTSKVLTALTYHALRAAIISNIELPLLSKFRGEIRNHWKQCNLRTQENIPQYHYFFIDPLNTKGTEFKVDHAVRAQNKYQSVDVFKVRVNPGALRNSKKYYQLAIESYLKYKKEHPKVFPHFLVLRFIHNKNTNELVFDVPLIGNSGYYLIQKETKGRIKRGELPKSTDLRKLNQGQPQKGTPSVTPEEVCSILKQEGKFSRFLIFTLLGAFLGTVTLVALSVLYKIPFKPWTKRFWKTVFELVRALRGVRKYLVGLLLAWGLFSYGVLIGKGFTILYKYAKRLLVGARAK